MKLNFKYTFWFIFVTIIVALFSEAYALEKDYQIPWCKSQNGLWEAPATTIRDQFTNKVEGYVDCITATHAIEVDFDKKWKEAKTQSEWYARNTGKRAGILLILTKNKNGTPNTGYKKLMDLINANGDPIDVWTVNQ